MAHTRHGNLTGKAASTALAEWRSDLIETQQPNSTAWYASADAQLVRLQNAIGVDAANTMTENITGTWQQIAGLIQVLADLAEAQHTKYDTGLELDGADTGVSQSVFF